MVFVFSALFIHLMGILSMNCFACKMSIKMFLNFFVHLKIQNPSYIQFTVQKHLRKLKPLNIHLKKTNNF